MEAILVKVYCVLVMIVIVRYLVFVNTNVCTEFNWKCGIRFGIVKQI